jgi:hypothetical protein
VTLNPLWAVMIVGDPVDGVTLTQVDIIWVNHASAYERFQLAIEVATKRWGRNKTDVRAFPFLHDDISRRRLPWADSKDAIPHIWLEKYK